MKSLWVAAAAAALLALVTGCPSPTAIEITEKALSPTSDLDKAEVHRELQRALKAAEEELAKDPKATQPYVTKAQLQWMKDDRGGAIETLHTALERSEPKNEAEKERVKLYLLWAYKEAGTVEMLKRGLRFLEERITEEGIKTVYSYHMGVYYRRLHQMTGEGTYKTEANRWFLACGEQLDDEILAELRGEGLCDPMLE